MTTRSEISPRAAEGGNDRIVILSLGIYDFHGASARTGTCSLSQLVSDLVQSTRRNEMTLDDGKD